MIKRIKIINRETNKEEVGTLRIVKKEEINKVMKLQEKIMSWLENTDLYAPSTEIEFIESVEGAGDILGCFNERNELIAMGCYCIRGIGKDNYGYDINLEGEKLLKTAQIESTVVHKDYRGNKLQNIICDEIEAFAIKDNMEILMATVSPDNPYSLNTFLKNGFIVKKEKLKYGGLKRAILEKNIKLK